MFIRGRGDTADDQLCCHSSDSPFFEANILVSTPSNLVASGRSVYLIPNGSDCGLVPSRSKMNDIDPSGVSCQDVN